MAKLITNLTQKIESIAAKSRLGYEIASLYYKDVIKKEILLADIKENDHILCIGGGVCPFSAILLHQKTGAKVTVIDNDSKCIPKAQKTIDRLGLADNVIVSHMDGANLGLKVSQYTIVHMAMQVFPMEHVFSQVEKHACVGTKFLVRNPKKGLDKLYSKLSDYLEKGCFGQTIHKKTRNIKSTLMYIKQERVA